MHTQIRLISGERLNFAQSFNSVDSATAKLGAIQLDIAPGIRRLILKASILDYFEFSDEEWDAMQKKAEEQKKADEEKRKAAAAEFAEEKDRQAKINQYDRWHEQPWHKKLWRKCPYSLPPAKAEAPAVEQTPATVPEEKQQ